jgi:osmoprotectant transport system permease protein
MPRGPSLPAKRLGKIAVLVAIGIAASVFVVLRPQDNLVASLVTGPRLTALIEQHLVIVTFASLLAALTGIPLGILLTRPALALWSDRVLAVVNVGQTVPSLAVVALSVGIFGIGLKTAVVALWIYSVLPILSNTMVGIRGLDRAILQAALGMGMTRQRIMTRVELPLALPMVLAGLRTSVTITIGSAILAAFVGGGGLGDLIIAGNNISRVQVLALGALLPVLMALIADTLFDLVEDRLQL